MYHCVDKFYTTLCSYVNDPSSSTIMQTNISFRGLFRYYINCTEGLKHRHLKKKFKKTIGDVQGFNIYCVYA